MKRCTPCKSKSALVLPSTTSLHDRIPLAPGRDIDDTNMSDKNQEVLYVGQSTRQDKLNISMNPGQIGRAQACPHVTNTDLVLVAC